MFFALRAVAISFLFYASLYSLTVELNVKECAGTGSNGYPIQTVVPLPAGVYQDTASFRLVDALGNQVPAQFRALGRRYLGDQSITHLLIVHMPVVAPFNGAGTGISKYYLRDDGSAGSISTTLSVEENSSQITVTTGGNLRFTVKKTGFNIIDQVWYDRNGSGDFSSGNLVVKSNNKNGGEFIGRLAGDIQFDADRADIKVELEESGPVRAVIRVEAVTKYYSPSNHTHGWAVRIYAYAGKPYIKVDYQLQNSSKTKRYSWPLYFNAMNLNFDLNISGTLTAKAGLGNGQVYSGSVGGGVLLAQKLDSLFKIYSVDGVGDTTTTIATGGRPDGFLNIDNGSVGLFVQTRNFWRQWPNGLRIDTNGRLTVQLFPEWSSQINAASKNPVFNSTGLYWLSDMQHVYKEVVFCFHNAVGNEELINLSRTIDYHPVASLPVSYLKTTGSASDFEIMPLTTRITSNDARQPSPLGFGSLGWNYFAFNGRRTGTATAGSYPIGGAKFWATENPSDWFTAERWAIGEMNIRPHWMAQYNFATDFNLLRLGMNNETGEPSFDPWSLRMQEMAGDKLDTAVIEETKRSWGLTLDCCEAIDNAHYWHYHIKDAYWMTGNLWQKDYYKFIVEFRKNMATMFILLGRQGAHPMADAINALNATGDSVMVRLVKENMANNFAKLRPQYGDYNILCCGSFGASSWHLGFGGRPIIDFLSQVRDADLQSWALGFQFFSAAMVWNLNYGNFGGYAWAPRVDASNGAAFTLLDPQSWYYWHTGKREFFDQMNKYIDYGIDGGTRPYNTTGISGSWDGDYSGRWIQFVRENNKPDNTPPPQITNLSIIKSGNMCTARWTAPAGAARYQFVWGSRPIVYGSTDDIRYLNWWAANPIGKLASSAGLQEELSFSVPDTGLIFAAVFSWDSSYNLSEMSNSASSDLTPATAPSGLSATVIDSRSVRLAWGASTDPESKIWGYAVYRNGVHIAFTDSLFHVDNALVELTSYDYVVRALSGSNLEGTPSQITVSTPADNESPTVVFSHSVSLKPLVMLVFSEKIDLGSAETVSNYSINNGVTVLSATLLSDSNIVVLTCDTLAVDGKYQVTINNVKDRSLASNAIASGTIVSFTHLAPLSITGTKPTEFIWDKMSTDVYCHIDEDSRVRYVPEKYRSLPLLRTGTYQTRYYSATDQFAVFTSNKPLKVYIMVHVQQTAKPTWLTSGYSPTGDTLGVAGDYHRYVIWSGEKPAGEVKIAGGGWNSNYPNHFIVVEPTDSSWITGLPEINIHYMEELLASGMLSHWKFDEASGSTVINSADTANNGILQGGVVRTSDGKYGEAVTLDGIDDYISTSISYNNPQNFSYSLWFKTTMSGKGVLLAFGNSQTGSGSTSYDRELYINGGVLSFRVYKAGNQVVSATSIVNDGNWHHVVASISQSGKMALYIDGVREGYNNSVTEAENLSGYFRIGSIKTADFFAGSIDDVRIYGRGLTASEVVALYGSDPVANEKEALALPNSFVLDGAHPNPFSRLTNIYFGIPNNGVKQFVSVKIYDLRGRLVKTILNDFVSPGRHKVAFNTNENGSKLIVNGFYLCRMKANGYDKTIPVLLVK